MRVFILFCVMFAALSVAFGHPTYTGYSGAPGRQTCASSCHGISGGTITLSGFPSSYTPGQQYAVTVAHNGGLVIANFNASVRVGTGTTNAGTIAGGTATSTYNVTGETNGVHFTNINQDMGTFNWAAPVAGTGPVRLYFGGHQGLVDDQNTELVLVAAEGVPPPAQATNPFPTNMAMNVDVNSILSWTAGAGASSHNVYFGTTNPPTSIGNQAGTTFSPGPMSGGTLYYWRIDEQGSGGTTTGNLWQFTTGFALIPPPTNLVILADQPYVRLNWNRAPIATIYEVYRAPSFGAPMVNVGFTTDTLFVDSTALGNPDVRAFYTVTATTP